MKLENKINIKVDIPEGYEICKEESTFENIVLIKKEENRREKLGKIAGCYISVTSDIVKVLQLEEASLKNRNFYPTKEFAEASLAISELLQYYFKDYKDYSPDFTDKNSKYIICVIKNIVSLQQTENKNATFVFPDYKTAYAFYTTYKELFELAKPLL
jgi:hypothetical protein|uniref:Uncharacterized protein n=1 Tax=Myoviridae sp. ctBDS4 TaxID=2823537 RepID=A0A8S5LEB8_9CAUD|nr:MAG TPA: hypothetical protein [Myoviridae sp. ctBDS4]